MEDSEKSVIFTGNLGVDYTQFYIDNDNDDDLLPDTAFKNQENGLCGGAQQGKLFFVPGLHDGYINLSIELYQQEPKMDNSFEEIVEVSLEISEPTMLCEWAHEETYDLDIPYGVYRVRYLVTGMDDEHDDETDCESALPSQCHLIQLWPSPKAKDKLIKCTSKTAGYWHSTWGKV